MFDESEVVVSQQPNERPSIKVILLRKFPSLEKIFNADLLTNKALPKNAPDLEPERDRQLELEKNAQEFVTILGENLAYFLEASLGEEVRKTKEFFEQFLAANEVVLNGLDLVLPVKDELVLEMEEVQAPFHFSEQVVLSRINLLIGDLNNLLSNKYKLDEFISAGFTFSVNTATGELETLNGVLSNASEFAEIVENLVEAVGLKDEQELGVILAAVAKAAPTDGQDDADKIISETKIAVVVEEAIQKSRASLTQQATDLADLLRSKNEGIRELSSEDKERVAGQSLELQFFIDFFRNILDHRGGEHFYGIDAGFLDKDFILQRVDSHFDESDYGLNWVYSLVGSISPRERLVYGPNGILVVWLDLALENLEKSMKSVGFEKKSRAHLQSAIEEIQQEKVRILGEKGRAPVAQKILLDWIEDKFRQLDSFSLEKEEMTEESGEDLTPDQVVSIIRSALSSYLSVKHSHLQEFQLNSLAEAIVKKERMKDSGYLEVAIYSKLRKSLRLRVSYASWVGENMDKVDGIRLTSGAPVDSDEAWEAVHNIASELRSELGVSCKVFERR